jgi:outer membrane receptor for ferrienterochelin and colicins
LESAAEDRWRLVNVDAPIHTWGAEALTRYRRGPIVATATYAFTRSTEGAGGADPTRDEAGRIEVALTPRHYAAFDLMLESARQGRVGIEAYYVGRQSLEDNPYRTAAPGQVIVGALVERRFNRIRLFANVENLADRRQTRYEPLVRPVRHPDGRWTVEAWGPLDGRVVNGGIRVVF